MATKHRARRRNSGERRDPRESPDPKYLRITRTLKSEIVDGMYAVGSQLPTEEELCERFKVSRYTVREALRRLREDNLITSRPRSGTVVVYRPSLHTYAHDVMTIEDLVSWSSGKRFVIETIELIEIDDKLEWTGLPQGERWLAVRGFGHTDGVATPHSWSEYYIHRDFAAIGRLLPRHSGPIFPLIEDMFGQTVVEVHQDIDATLVPASLAERLKVPANSAGLRVRRAFTTSDGRLAQVTFSTHPASSYSYSMTLRRVRS